MGRLGLYFVQTVPQEISQLYLLLTLIASDQCNMVACSMALVQRANKISLDIPSSHPSPSNQIGPVTTFGWQVCKLFGSLRQSQCDLIFLYRTQQNEAQNLICSL